MEDIFIYGLLCPLRKQVMYVGKAIDPEQRLQEHISESQTRRKTKKEKWIGSLLDQGLLPSVTVLDICSLRNWRNVEQKWISYYELRNPDLCNTKGATLAQSTLPVPPTVKQVFIVKPTFKECLSRLQAQNKKVYTWGEIAGSIGMTPQGVRSLFAGEADRLYYSTLGKLGDFFAAEGLPVTPNDLLAVETVVCAN